MLNIIKSKLNTTFKNKSFNEPSITKYRKDVTPVVRNWKSSIYAFNKRAIDLIPINSRFVIRLIKGYLNAYNLRLEANLRRRRIRVKQRRQSTNKIYVSDGEFKHTNDKVSITVYVYNRQKLNYLLALKKKYIRLFKTKGFKIRLKKIKQAASQVVAKHKHESFILANVLPKYNSSFFIIHRIIYKRFILRMFKRLRYFMFLKQMLYINKAKFEYSYIQGLINLIRKIYNKDVEFNIINLKYFYFNSSIYTQALVLRYKKKMNVFKHLNPLVRKVKLKKIKLAEQSDKFFIINQFDTDDKINGLIDQNTTKSVYLKKIILDRLKYKRVSGVRVEVAGRLTRRFSASRANKKMSYKGNLVNVYSSLIGRPTPVLSGKYKANLDRSVINSWTQAGTFGVKGWIGGT